MRSLAEYNAAPFFGAQFFGPSRTIEKISEIQRLDHAWPAILATGNKGPRSQDRRIKTVAMAHDQLHAPCPRRVDHRAAFAQRQGHWFFDQDMFAGGGGQFGMRDMKLVRRCDVDHIDIGIAA